MSNKPKKYEEFSEMSEDELWDYCMLEYNSTGFINKHIIENFYNKIKLALDELNNYQSVLEIGCGAGESSKRIFEMLYGRHFEASEYDSRYVRKLKGLNLPYKVTQESVYNLNRSNSEFDVILLLEVLEHLEDVENALSELFRVSKKYVIISVPNEPIWRIANMARLKYLKDFGNTPGHINHFSASSLKKILSKYGEIKKVYRPFPWIIVLAEKK
ncbi:MAG: methyltransferase domain-containing protein [bacterium]